MKQKIHTFQLDSAEVTLIYEALKIQEKKVREKMFYRVEHPRGFMVFGIGLLVIFAASSLAVHFDTTPSIEDRLTALEQRVDVINNRQEALMTFVDYLDLKYQPETNTTEPAKLIK